MKAVVISVTKRGAVIANKISNILDADNHSKFSKTLVKELYHKYDALVFVMALGIVVRTIASEIGDKKNDPLVVAVDESGKHVISVLSGHRGANELARKIAAEIGAEPVVTTASDVQGKECVEDLAEKFGLALDYDSGVKSVNASIVNDGKVGLIVDPALAGRDGLLHHVHLSRGIPMVDSSAGCDALVVVTNKAKYSTDLPAAILRPKNLVVGMGSRKGVDEESVLTAIRKKLKEANLSVSSIKALATVDFKAKEKGFLRAASKLKVPLIAVSKQEIKRNENRFQTSETVRAKVGIGAVCEPSAVLAGRNAKLVSGKMRYDGVTVAIAEDGEWVNSS